MSIIALYWIDVCPTNENLLALACDDKSIKFFDKREMKIMRSFTEYLNNGKAVGQVKNH